MSNKFCFSSGRTLQQASGASRLIIRNSTVRISTRSILNLTMLCNLNWKGFFMDKDKRGFEDRWLKNNLISVLCIYVCHRVRCYIQQEKAYPRATWGRRQREMICPTRQSWDGRLYFFSNGCNSQTWCWQYCDTWHGRITFQIHVKCYHEYKLTLHIHVKYCHEYKLFSCKKKEKKEKGRSMHLSLKIKINKLVSPQNSGVYVKGLFTIHTKFLQYIQNSLLRG